MFVPPLEYGPVTLKHNITACKIGEIGCKHPQNMVYDEHNYQYSITVMVQTGLSRNNTNPSPK